VPDKSDGNENGPAVRQHREAAILKPMHEDNIRRFPEPQDNPWVRADAEWFAEHCGRRVFRARPVFAGEWRDLARRFDFDPESRARRGWQFTVIVARPGIANPDRIPILEPDLGLRGLELVDCDATLAALHRLWTVAFREGGAKVPADALLRRVDVLRHLCACRGACAADHPVPSVRRWLENYREGLNR
jgi:hypothetical protein